MKVVKSAVASFGKDNHFAKIVLSNEVQPQKNKSQHFSLLLDVSGSMSGSLTALKNHVLGFISSLLVTDFVSIHTFSGQGEARLIMGPIKCDVEGKSALQRTVQNIRTQSTTVFSEGLQLVNEQLKTLQGVNFPPAQFLLFTDGCAVAPWGVAEEEKRAIQLAEQLGRVQATVSTVGFGNYYNADFLKKVVRAGGNHGTERHVQDINSFVDVVGGLRDYARVSTSADMSLVISSNAGPCQTVLSPFPEVKQVGQNGQVRVGNLTDGCLTLFVQVPSGASQFKITGTIDGETVDLTAKAKPATAEEVGEGLLVFASYAFEQGDQERAGDLISAAGNETLSVLVANANTTQEKLVIGDELRRVLADAGVKQRYSTKKSFIGKGQAPSVANMLRVLIEQDENGNVSRLFIPPGEYIRTGVKTEEAGIRRKPNAAISVYDVGSNQERFNFNFRTEVEVEAQGPDGKWVSELRERDYVVIKDGSLHLKSLQGYLTEKAFNLAQSWGVIAADLVYSDQTLYDLDLTVLPVIVSSWANPKQLGLVDLMMEAVLLQSRQTALNARVKDLRKGVTTGSSSAPQRTKQAAVDSYNVDCVQYELKGFSAPKPGNLDKLDLATAEAELEATRKRLSRVRFLTRLIQFAMERVGNKLFAGITPTPAPRSPKKLEQVVSLASLGHPGLSLRRVSWTEEIPVSEPAVDAAAATATA